MNTFDKASWQIDNGIDKNIVISHFEFIFKWLQQHHMLNEDGIEILDIGIDEDVSLYDGLLTKGGITFLELCYDNLISKSEYKIEQEKTLLDEFYNQWISTQ